MKTAQLATVVGAAVSLLGLSSANACGDKLAMMGGGVSFETLNSNLHHGRVVIFITPESSLHASTKELKKTLERAGHKVRSVDNAADFKHALQSGDVDVVLTNLGENQVPVQVATGSRTPAVLSVIYKPTTDVLAGTSIDVTCTTRAEKARGRQTIEDIENVLAHKGRGLAANCAPTSDSKST